MPALRAVVTPILAYHGVGAAFGAFFARHDDAVVGA